MRIVSGNQFVGLLQGLAIFFPPHVPDSPIYKESISFKHGVSESPRRGRNGKDPLILFVVPLHLLLGLCLGSKLAIPRIACPLLRVFGAFSTMVSARFLARRRTSASTEWKIPAKSSETGLPSMTCSAKAARRVGIRLNVS